MNVSERTADILKSVDELIHRVAAWKDDPNGDPIVPDVVIAALDAAVIVCADGDIPQMCRQLASEAIPALYDANRRYEASEYGFVRNETGAPDQPWWRAVIAVEQARMGAVAPVYESLEPVAVLRRQGVTDEQIAMAIYGRRGEGPFMNDNGTVNYAKIQKEVDTPGSVLGENWVPPWVDQALAEARKSVQNRLAAYAVIAENKPYEDPASIEELLRDGAYVQQIMHVKRVDRKTVLAKAESLGIKAVDAPGAEIDWRDAPVKTDQSPATPPRPDAPLGVDKMPDTGLSVPHQSLEEMAAEVAARSDAPTSSPEQEDPALSSLVIEKYERAKSKGTELGAAELSEAMGGALVVKPSRVSEILSDHLRQTRKKGASKA